MLNKPSAMSATASTLPCIDCSTCPVRFNAVCANCSPTEFEQLNEIKRFRRYGAGTMLVAAGEELPFVGSLVEGTVCLSKSLEDGRRQIVGLLLPSDFIGRPGRLVSEFDMFAATDVELCQFNNSSFAKILAASPAISERMLEMTMDELDAARVWMLLLGRSTSRERLTSFIALLVQHEARLRRGMVGTSAEVSLPLTRTMIADYLGLTIETVSRQLSRLKHDGLIQFRDRRRISVPSCAALLNETGDSETWTSAFGGAQAASN